MGSHIGASVAHTTLRSHRLGFRGVAAIFGAFGVEWNLLDAGPSDLDQLAHIVALHKRFRSLLHTGPVVRTDHPDPTVEVHGVVAADRREALLAVTRLASGPTHHTAPIQVPGLDDATLYEMSVVADVFEPLGHAREQPPWVDGKLAATGRQLRVAGFRTPQLFPESSMLVHLRAVGEADG
jgi:alpha-galactosidase